MADEGTDDPLGGDLPFETRILADGYAYWKTKCTSNGLPSRADIKPAEIPRLLPNFILLDVIYEPPLDFRYRLIGTHVVEHSHGDYTGRCFSHIEHQRQTSQVWNNCRRVVETPKPLYARTPYAGPQAEFRRSENVILPLSDNGTDVDALLVFVEYLSRAKASPHLPSLLCRRTGTARLLTMNTKVPGRRTVKRRDE